MTRAVDSPTALVHIVELATLVARQATYSAICDAPEVARFRFTLAGTVLKSWTEAGGESADLTAQVLQAVGVSIVRREVTKVVAGALVLHPDEGTDPPIWTFTAQTPDAHNAGTLLCSFLAAAQDAYQGQKESLGWGRDKILDHLRGLSQDEVLAACSILIGANAAVLGPVP